MYPNPGDVRLDPSWPGLDLRPDEIEVDPDTLDRVAGLVRSEHYAHMDGYSTGTLPFLRSAEMREDGHWFGFWPTAEYMELGLEEARSTIVYYYEVLDQQIAAAADLFTKTAEEYREVEQGLRAGLEATTAEGWDRLATPAAAGGGIGPAAAGTFQGTTPITGIMAPEDTSDYNPDWILSEIARVKGNETWRLLGLRGDTFAAVADRLDDIAMNLKNQVAQTLAQEWNSETAVAAQRALQLIAGTATHLAEASRDVADYAYRSGEALQTAVNDFPDDSGVNWWDDLNDVMTVGGNPRIQAKHNEIRQKLATLNESYTHINNLKLPKQISAQLPQLNEIPPPRDDIWGPGGGGGGSGFVPSSPPRMPSLPAGDVGPSGSVPERFSGVAQVPGTGQVDPGIGGGTGEIGAPAGSGGLAGVGPGGAGTVPGGMPGGAGVAGPGGVNPGGAGVVPGGGAGTVGPGGVGMVPGGAGAAGRGGGGGRPGTGTGGMGRGGGVMGVPMGGAGGTGAGGRGSGGKPGGVRGAGGGSGGPVGGASGAGGAAGGRGGVAGGMMPMAGGAGRGSEERHSQPDSWLVEDDDPWRPDDDVPPGVIR